MDVVEIPSDFWNEVMIEMPRPRIYYDATTGIIRGVSFVTDADLEKQFAILFVAEEIATRLMTGEENIDAWLVNESWTPNPKLVRGTELDIEPTGVIELVRPTTEQSSLVTLKISIARVGGFVGFQFQSAGLSMITRANFDLYFVVTRRHNPQAILGVFRINAKELMGRQMVARRLSVDVGEEIDIYTDRCEPLDYAMEIVDRIRPILPVPAVGFEDIRLLGRAPKMLPPSLTVDRRDDELVLKLHEGGGAVYDRRLSTMLLALVAPGDPHRLLDTLWVPLEELDEFREIRLPLSAGMLDREFDICTQMLYHSAYDVRTPSN